MDKYQRPAVGGEGRRGLGGVFDPSAVDLPLFGCSVLVHVDGGDGVLGAGLDLPVHLPLGVLRLGLQQVHPFLGFDPTGKQREKRG